MPAEMLNLKKVNSLVDRPYRLRRHRKSLISPTKHPLAKKQQKLNERVQQAIENVLSDDDSDELSFGNIGLDDPEHENGRKTPPSLRGSLGEVTSLEL